MLLAVTVLPTNVTANESGPVLDVHVLRGFQFAEPPFIVKNIGDETAHNVTLTDIAVDGNVHYTNRSMKIADEMEPGHWTEDFLGSYIVGYGFFSITLTVTCDEGVFYSDKTNGIIIGPFMFIL